MVSAVSQKKIPTWREVIGESVLIEYKLKFALNFSYGKMPFPFPVPTLLWSALVCMA